MTQPTSQGSIQVDIHPPERSRRRVVLCVGGCCCCCCLHAAGGLVGAAIGSVIAEVRGSAKPWSPLPETLEPFRPSEAGSLREHVAERPAAADHRALSGPQTRDPGVDGLSGAALYWLTLGALTLCTGPALCVWNGLTPALDEFPLLGFIIVMILPAIQLVASLASALFVLLYEPADRMVRWRAIAIITGWSFMGAVVGVLLLCMLR